MPRGKYPRKPKSPRAKRFEALEAHRKNFDEVEPGHFVSKPTKHERAIANAESVGYEAGYKAASEKAALSPRDTAYYEMVKAISQGMTAMASALDNFRG